MFNLTLPQRLALVLVLMGGMAATAYWALTP